MNAQTSLGQQSFPALKMADLGKANQAVRRATLDKDLCILFEPIDPDKLTIACHSDTAFANTHPSRYIIAFTEKPLQNGAEAKWVPATWRSYKLSRAVGSTLAAESEAFYTASGSVEWLSLMLAEILDGDLILRERGDVLKRRPPILVTDCKSLYLVSLSART